MAMKKEKIKIIFDGEDPLLVVKTPLEILLEEYNKNEAIIKFFYGFMCGCGFVFFISLTIILIILRFFN